jgi:hypothetical protein
MRKLFLLLPLLLTPAAQAMDYVKCEAMQKALGRIEGSMRTEIDDAVSAFLKPALRKVSMDCIYNHKAKGYDYEFECTRELNKPILKQAHTVAEPIIAKWTPRIEKIKADYEAEGCY